MRVLAAGVSGVCLAGLLSNRIGEEAAQARQIRASRVFRPCSGRGCCPIGTQGRQEVRAHPDGGTDDAHEPGEAAAPARDVFDEAQDQVDERGGPYLPFDGVRVLAVEAAELERLLKPKLFAFK